MKPVSLAIFVNAGVLELNPSIDISKHNTKYNSPLSSCARFVSNLRGHVRSFEWTNPYSATVSQVVNELTLIGGDLFDRCRLSWLRFVSQFSSYSLKAVVGYKYGL